MTTDTDTFTFTREMPLPPDRLWHLMPDPKMREIWGAPGEDTVLHVVSSDLRVGGTDHHRCGPRDAPEFEVETRWYRLGSPHDAVFTEVVTAQGSRLGASLGTYRLAPSPRGTALTVTIAVSSFVGPDMIAEFRSGWTGGMENLDRLVAREGAPS